MSTAVTLPALGESVTEGTVSRWLKQVGDTVEADEPLLEVSTDKVDTEIPSPAAGVLLEIKAAEDETVEVGAVLAVDRRRERGAGGDVRRSGGGEQRREPSEPEPEPEPEPETRRREVDEPKAEPRPSSAAARARRVRRRLGRRVGGGTEVTLPALGESVTEGTVSRWLKQVGESVAADEPLLEISTDKVDTEIPSPAAGILLEIRVQEDETVEVGAVLAVVGEEGAAPERRPPRPRRPRTETATETGGDDTRGADRGRRRGWAGADPGARAGGEASARARSPKPQHGAEPRPQPRRRTEASAEGGGRRSYVTPLVRKLAREHNVDLGFGDRHRGRRPDPQAGRPGRGRGGQEGRRGTGGRTRRRRPRARGRAAPAAADGRDQRAARHHREDVPAAQDHRQADGRVAAGLGPAHRDRRGRPDRHLADPGPPRTTSRPARAPACPTCRSSPRPRSRR